MKINPEELLALIAGAEAKGAMEQRYRDAMGEPVESTRFAPPFPRLEDPVFAQAVQDEVRRLEREKPNDNLPSSLATLQNGPTVRMGMKEFDDHPKPRINVTDGQTYATADLEGVDVPDGEYDMWHDFSESFDPEPYAPRIINRVWHWTNLEGQACDAPLGYWTYLRYKGPLPEAEPTPQGLPSAEELAEHFFQSMPPRQHRMVDWCEWEDFDAGEQQQLITAMQAVRDAVLQALPDVAELERQVAYYKQCDKTASQKYHGQSEYSESLEAKVRELEKSVAFEKDWREKVCEKRTEAEEDIARLEADVAYKLGIIEQLTETGARHADRAEKAEAQLAALGTPIDPKDVVLHKEYLVLCRARITNYQKEKRVPITLRFLIGMGECESEGLLPIDPIIYPYAPTE